MPTVGASRSTPARDPRTVALVASAAGYPLTQAVITRWGRPGAAVVVGVTLALAVRDLGLLAVGTTAGLRRGPAVLLWVEAGAAVAATALTVPLVRARGADDQAPASPGSAEWARRLAIGSLFGVHTLRFWIYLQPDQGRRGA